MLGVGAAQKHRIIGSNGPPPDTDVPARRTRSTMPVLAAQPRKAEIREQLALYARDDRERRSVGRRRRHLLEVESEVPIPLGVRQALLRLPGRKGALSETTGVQVLTLPSAGVERRPKRRRGSRPITAGQSQRDRERTASEEPLHEILLCVIARFVQRIRTAWRWLGRFCGTRGVVCDTARTSGVALTWGRHHDLPARCYRRPILRLDRQHHAIASGRESRQIDRE